MLKLYPGRLRIAITERKAFALWQKEGRLYLIAADGTVLETYVPPRFAALPLVVGDGAEHGAKDFLHLLKAYPEIEKSVARLVLVADGAGTSLEERRRSAAAGARAGAGAGHAGRSRRDKKLLSRDIVDRRSAAGRPRHRAAVRCRRRGARRGAEGGREGQEGQRKGSDA